MSLTFPFFNGRSRYSFIGRVFPTAVSVAAVRARKRFRKGPFDGRINAYIGEKAFQLALCVENKILILEDVAALLVSVWNYGRSVEHPSADSLVDPHSSTN
jgi:hypothetical protein